MIVNAFALAALYAINKQLLKGLPSSQATFLYKLAVFLVIGPWVLRKGLKGIKTPVMHLHILRAFLSITGSLCFAYGLKHTNVVNATALGYIEQVLWAIVGVIYFKEQMTSIKFLAIIGSFTAMVLIMFPTLPEAIINWLIGNEVEGASLGFDYHYVFVIIAAISWAMNSTIIKVLGKSVKNEVQAFYVLFFSVIIAYPTAFFNWNWHSIGDTFLSYPTFGGLISWSEVHLTETQMIQIGLLALMYFIHVFSFFLSLKYAEMSTVAPFDYLRLVFTCFFAYLLIGDVPQYKTQYIGYAMIILSGVVLVTSERRKRQKEALKQQLECQIENV